MGILLLLLIPFFSTVPDRTLGNHKKLIDILFTAKEKNRGDRGSVPYGKSLSSATFGSLMLTVVALDPFNLAVTDALVCAHFDKFLCNHSNGDSNKIWSVCFLF